MPPLVTSCTAGPEKSKAGKQTMMKLQTPVETTPGKIRIAADDKILILGSCFADNIGKRMKDIGLDVCVNPFGTLYNPASLATAVERLASGRPFTPSECRMMGSGAGLVCSFSHHTSFARRTEEEFLDNANASLEQASDFFGRCGKIIVTLGTSWCYRHSEDNIIVSNCLKRNAAEFLRFRLSTEEAVRYLETIVSIAAGTAQGGKPAREIIFTVSPIRHLRDGAHGNQLSKATLLLAVDEICGKYGCCDYFPAYEIVLDELRDYRFYAEDMLHPSQQTINYIWERFCGSVMSDADRQKVLEMEKLYRQSCHRPNLHLQ